MQNRYERLIRWGLGLAILFFSACSTDSGGCGEDGCGDGGCVAYRDGCGTGIKLVQGESDDGCGGGCGLSGCVAGCIDLESCINDCDTCSSCELIPDTAGLPKYNLPGEAPEIKQAIQLHATNNLFDFINERAIDAIVAVAGDALGDGFSINEQGEIQFVVETVGVSETGIEVDVCPDNCTIVARLDPDIGIVVRPSPPNNVTATITIDTVRFDDNGQAPYTGSLPIDGTAIGFIPIECDVEGGFGPNSDPISVELPIRFTKNGATGHTELEVVGENLELNLDTMLDSINLTGLCNSVGGLIDIPDLVNSVVGSIKGITCRGCAANADCAPGATCQDGVCNGPSYEVCQPIELGATLAADLTPLLSGFLPGLSAQLGVSAFLADLVQAEADEGIELGMSFGAASIEIGSVANGLLSSSVSRDACVPNAPAPNTGSDCADGATCPRILDIVDSTDTPVVAGVDIDGNDVTFGGEPFQLGVGISLSTINTVLWGLYQSGMLCLDIDSNTVEELSGLSILSTGLIGSLAQSLNRATESRDSQLQISIRPSSPPYVELGESLVETTTVEEGGDSFPATPLNLKMDSAALDFYAEVEGRFVRVFTAVVSLDVPLKVGVDGSALIVSLPTDAAALADAIIYEGADNVEYMTENEVDFLFGQLSSLLGGVVGLIGLDELIPPIDLGDLTDSLGGLTITLPSPGIAAVADGTALGAFVNIDFDPNALPDLGAATQPLVPVVTASEVVHPENAREIISQAVAAGEPMDFADLSPTVQLSLDTLGAGSPDVQYAYSIDGLGWSTWTDRDSLEIENAFLGLEGHHTIRVRVRESNDWSTVGTEFAKVRVTTDHTPPNVTIDSADGEALVTITDNLSHAERMTMRYRIDDSEWTPASQLTDTIGLAAWAGQTVEVTVQATDASGNTQTVARRIAVAASDSEDKQSAGEEAAATEQGAPALSGGSPRAGCTSAPGVGGAPLGGVALLFGILLGLRRLRNRRGLLAMIVVTAIAGFGMTGCKDDKGGNGDLPSGCDPACEEGFSCESNASGESECIPEALVCTPACTDDEVCESGTCVDAPAECDPECTGGDICRDGTCVTPESVCFTNADCTDANESCYLGNEFPDDTRSCVDGVVCPTAREVCDCGDFETEEFTGATENQYGFCENPDEASCECLPPQPLALGTIHKYNDAEVNPTDQTRRFTVSYNKTYGDLMFGELNADDSIDWEFVDGVPLDEPPTNEITGPRDGISARGENVGRYASLAVTTGPVVHISYLATTAEGVAELRYARGTEEGEAWTFETVAVDSMDSAGYFTDISVDEANSRIVIAYVAANMVNDADTPAQYFGELRLARANTLEPMIADDFSQAPPVAQLESDYPCGSFCGASGAGCIASTNVCGPITNGCGACAEDEGCFEDGSGGGTCRTRVAQSNLVRLPGTVGLFADVELAADGVAHLAYYDRVNGNLRYSRVDVAATPMAFIGAEPNIVDGETGQGGQAVDTGDVGLFPDVVVLADGSVRIAYYNASNGSLWGADPIGGAVMELVNGESTEEITYNDGSIDLYVDALVGADVDIIELADGSLVLVYQDASEGNLMELNWDGVVGASTATDVAVVAGAAEGDEYEGAFGFFTDQAISAAGRFIVGTRFLFNSDTQEGYESYALTLDGEPAVDPPALEPAN